MAARKKTAKRTSRAMKDLKPRKASARSVKGGLNPSGVVNDTVKKVRETITVYHKPL